MMLVRNLARPHCSLLVVHTAQLQGQLKLLLIASSPPFDICYNSTSTPFFRLYTKIAEFATQFMRWFNISFQYQETLQHHRYPNPSQPLSSPVQVVRIPEEEVVSVPCLRWLARPLSLSVHQAKLAQFMQPSQGLREGVYMPTITNLLIVCLSGLHTPHLLHLLAGYITNTYPIEIIYSFLMSYLEENYSPNLLCSLYSCVHF